MAATLTLSSSLTAGGASVSGSNTRTVSNQIGITPDLEAGQAGSLTTRTDADTGAITLDDSATPTVTTSDLVTVFWDGGVRYNMSVTNVTGSVVTVDGGAGDNLPTALTDVVIGKDVHIDTDFDGDLVELLAIGCSSSARIHVRMDTYVGTDSTPTIAVDIPAGESESWKSGGLFDNPLAGVTIGAMAFSNGSTSAVTAQVAIGYDGSI